MEAWRWLRQREARPPRRSPRRRLSRGKIILLVLLVGFIVVLIPVLIMVWRGGQAERAAAATRAATLKDGDYAAIDVRDLAANPHTNDQRPVVRADRVVSQP